MHLEIARRRIGPGHPCYIIAELSANHHQRFEDAIALVRIAKEVGADAVKLQTYTADTLTIQSESRLFRHSKDSLWAGKSLYELYQEAYTPWDWQPKLQQLALDLGITLFSTPFDPTAVDFLEGMQVPAYKVASFELVDIPLIERIARTGKPMILSTGMASLEEIGEAVQAARSAGVRGIALLKCTSAYPAPPEEMNLRTIPDLAERFGVVVGLSDHTLGITVPVAAVALGACLIEKHLTTSRQIPGPDSAFSLEPEEFRQMVEAVRVAERALGTVQYGASERERESRSFRRSLFVVENVRAGEPFTSSNVRSIRPGHGLPPKYYAQVLGARATRDIPKGTPLSWDLVASAPEKAGNGDA
jgi:N-acetylneuraminate synthase